MPIKHKQYSRKNKKSIKNIKKSIKNKKSMKNKKSINNVKKYSTKNKINKMKCGGGDSNDNKLDAFDYTRFISICTKFQNNHIKPFAKTLHAYNSNEIKMDTEREKIKITYKQLIVNIGIIMNIMVALYNEAMTSEKAILTVENGAMAPKKAILTLENIPREHLKLLRPNMVRYISWSDLWTLEDVIISIPIPENITKLYGIGSGNIGLVELLIGFYKNKEVIPTDLFPEKKTSGYYNGSSNKNDINDNIKQINGTDQAILAGCEAAGLILCWPIPFPSSSRTNIKLDTDFSLAVIDNYVKNLADKKTGFIIVIRTTNPKSTYSVAAHLYAMTEAKKHIEIKIPAGRSLFKYEIEQIDAYTFEGSKDDVAGDMHNLCKTQLNPLK